MHKRKPKAAEQAQDRANRWLAARDHHITASAAGKRPVMSSDQAKRSVRRARAEVVKTIRPNRARARALIGK